MGFGAAIGTAQIIPLQIRVVSRERVSGLYRVLPFYVATFIAQAEAGRAGADQALRCRLS